MPLAIACPKCKKQYKLPDKFRGKPVTCTACKAQFKVPAGKPGSRPVGTANPQAAAKRQQAQAAARKRASELQQLGVDGPIRRAPDVFDGLGQMQGTPDPLANHQIEDPGFGEANVRRETADINESADPMAGMFENPALAAPKKKRMQGKAKKKVSGGIASQAWILALVIFLPLYVLLPLLTGFEVIPQGVSFVLLIVLLIIHMIASVVSWIWILVQTYRTTESGLQTALTGIIPFYFIYPATLDWDSMKHPTFFYLVVMFVFPASVVIISAIGFIVGLASPLFS